MCAPTPETKEEQVVSQLGSILPLEKKIKDLSGLKPQKIILIAGPTACGKSDLSLILAEMLKGEIISADSMQVYRGMDIGTAKVSQEDQARIPHHLIDIRQIQESFNVVDFYFEARQCIDSILARSRVPIIVGGSGFYFRALLYGPPSGPPSISEVRERLENELELIGNEAMYEQLKEIDPAYAASITPNDRQKVIRALEIVTLTGERVSKNQWTRSKPLPDYAYHSWFIYRPREVLYPSIDMRCEQMLEAGLIDEVKELEKQGLRMNPSASQAIGYRQCLEFLATSQSEQEYKKFVRKFKTASRQYAKRQFTWFRKEPLFPWLNVDLHDLEIAADMIAQEFNSTV
ncbi:MAG: tRNA (adenosine(37)-N6)-dimethylallyltransferase MiaA [Chlamydiales bacterium]|nr:tRNA (adenosine(37)-N6)-dimethylallyltransferase MiaA [Chlamydiales bacterium]